MAARVARAARRPARLLCVHRLHCARRRGDRRRGIPGAKPGRWAGARGPGHPGRGRGVLADPSRSRSAGARIPGEQRPRIGRRHHAGHGARRRRARRAHRDQGGRRSISALRRRPLEPASAAAGTARGARRHLRRGRGSGVACPPRSRSRITHSRRREHRRNPGEPGGRTRQARRRDRIRAAAADEPSRAARDRIAAAREPRALDLPAAPARHRCRRPRDRRGRERGAQRLSGCGLGDPNPRQCLSRPGPQHRALHAIPDLGRPDFVAGRRRRRRQRGEELPRSQARRDRDPEGARRHRPGDLLDLSRPGAGAGLARHRHRASGRRDGPVPAGHRIRGDHSRADRARALSGPAGGGAALWGADRARICALAARARPRRPGIRIVPRRSGAATPLSPGPLHARGGSRRRGARRGGDRARL